MLVDECSRLLDDIYGAEVLERIVSILDSSPTTSNDESMDPIPIPQLNLGCAIESLPSILP